MKKLDYQYVKSVMLGVILLISGINASLANTRQDSLIAIRIKTVLNGNATTLQFPNSVTRVYKQGDYMPVWIKPLTNPRPTWNAMMLLDCVKQYGLTPDDYHPQQLSYDRLHTMLETPENITDADKAYFDILLTDALITLINHLHYGKLNPVQTPAVIDAKASAVFDAGLVLRKAIRFEDPSAVILGVQPAFTEYADLQSMLRLMTGQYVGDCYETSGAEVQKVAINLERLRWVNTDDKAYLLVNIPSYTLQYHLPDTAYRFRVVGKPLTPTPALQSMVKYFTTAPDWRVPNKIFIKELMPKALRDTSYLTRNQFALFNSKGQYVAATPAMLKQISNNPAGYSARQSSGCDNALGLIVFRFDNPYSIYLHDTPEKSLFAQTQRALSHGCVRVENADKLAALLLLNDGAAGKVPILKKALLNYQTNTFILKRGVAIKITYLTCMVTDGVLTNYPDI